MRELENFAKNLKAIRTKMGLSRKALERKSGIIEWSISHWERGERFPTLRSALIIAKALGCTLDGMCGMQAPKNKG